MYFSGTMIEYMIDLHVQNISSIGYLEITFCLSIYNLC